MGDVANNGTLTAPGEVSVNVVLGPTFLMPFTRTVTLPMRPEDRGNGYRGTAIAGCRGRDRCRAGIDRVSHGEHGHRQGLRVGQRAVVNTDRQRCCTRSAARRDDRDGPLVASRSKEIKEHTRRREQWWSPKKPPSGLPLLERVGIKIDVGVRKCGDHHIGRHHASDRGEAAGAQR